MVRFGSKGSERGGNNREQTRPRNFQREREKITPGSNVTHCRYTHTQVTSRHHHKKSVYL